MLSSWQLLAEQKSKAAAEVRARAEELKKQKDKEDQQYAKRSEQLTKQVNKGRERVKESKNKVLNERRAGVAKERSNDALSQKLRALALRRNQEKVAAVYESRYVSRDEEDRMKNTPLHQLPKSAEEAKQGEGEQGGDGALTDAPAAGRSAEGEGELAEAAPKG